MTDFSIFDEQYYLNAYPDVRAIVNSGLIGSGLEHFKRFGLQEGRTKVSRYYDESVYLASYNDVDRSVKTGAFVSGLQHFIRYGFEEKRTRISPSYNEAFYLRSNPDVLDAVRQNKLINGLQHFLKFGLKEGRASSSFVEPVYLKNNPDIKDQVERYAYKTGFDHYLQVGQFERRPGTFSGTRGSDSIVAGGALAEFARLTGVEVGFSPLGANPSDKALFFKSTGTGEVDILTGSPGKDKFYLGGQSAFIGATPVKFYQGQGVNDYALIKNFDQVQDEIILPGGVNEYTFQPIGQDLNIFSASGDLMAIVQGVTQMQATSEKISDITDPFLFNAQVTVLR
jgi:hypothetical protein